MADEESDSVYRSETRRSSSKRQENNPFGIAGLLAAALAILLILGALMVNWWPFGGGGGGGGGSGFSGSLFGKTSSAACERPQYVTGRQPQFGEQQQEIRTLRRRAFRGDFFSQIDLAGRYEGRGDDRNLRDPVESAVWYAMALANPQGYSQTAARERRTFGRGGGSSYDGCRAHERNGAYRSVDRLLGNMTSKERDKVRDRVAYVLYTQGSDGMRVLARLHDAGSGPFGEPSDNGEARWAWGRNRGANTPAAVQLFERNDVDAYMYDYLAHQRGDVGAYVMMREFVSGRRRDIAEVARSKAASWVPPYEFYPPDAPESGTPHSDESRIDDDQAESALQDLEKLPFRHVSRALTYLGVSKRAVDSARNLPAHDAATFQAMLGRRLTGKLSPLERVRAIQYAAVNGSPESQLVLAVMYSEGVGVATDYARAFYWYMEADRQGSAEAKYAISNFFSLGVSGIADQDRAKSVVYQIDAALSGFKPSAERLREVLKRVGGHRRPRGTRGRSGSEYYAPPSTEYPTSPPPGMEYPATSRSYPGPVDAAPDDTAAAGDTRPAAAPSQPALEGDAQ